MRIGDRKGKSFKIHIATPTNWDLIKNVYVADHNSYRYPMTGSRIGKSEFGKIRGGNWRAVDKGFIRYNSGKIISTNSGVREGDLTTNDLYLMNLDGSWGIKLFEYEYVWNVNEAGNGFVIQPWVLQMTVGRFSWTLVD